jgi:LysM repeat protein
MRGSTLNRRPMQSYRRQILAGRGSVQVIVGALAIAAIVLAFTTFRPDDTNEASSPASVPAKATVVEAGALAAQPTAKAVPSPTKPPAASQKRIHTVASGDTLSSIAEQYYGDASKWETIFEANKDILPDANSLKLGQELKIPD